jgi:hypothetical protein
VNALAVLPCREGNAHLAKAAACDDVAAQALQEFFLVLRLQHRSHDAPHCLQYMRQGGCLRHAQNSLRRHVRLQYLSASIGLL